MVQMKRNGAGGSRRGFLLYIPHGSDETLSSASASATFWNLYIPHGSDETPVIHFSKNIRKSPASKRLQRLCEERNLCRIH